MCLELLVTAVSTTLTNTLTTRVLNRARRGEASAGGNGSVATVALDLGLKTFGGGRNGKEVFRDGDLVRMHSVWSLC